MAEGGAVSCVEADGREASLGYFGDVAVDLGCGFAGRVVVVRSVGDGPFGGGGAYEECRFVRLVGVEFEVVRYRIFNWRVVDVRSSWCRYDGLCHGERDILGRCRKVFRGRVGVFFSW